MLPQQLASVVSVPAVVSACKWLYLNFKCVNCALVLLDFYLSPVPFPGASPSSAFVPSFGLRPDRLSLITAQVKHTVAKWKLQPLCPPSTLFEMEQCRARLLNNGSRGCSSSFFILQLHAPPLWHLASLPATAWPACQGDIIISVAGPRTSFISFKFCVIVMRFKRFPW